MNPDRDFKHIEHDKYCRRCGAVAVVRRRRRCHYYCAQCFHLKYQKIPRTNLTAKDVIAALQQNVIRGRTAAEILDRILKEKTV